MSKGTTIKDALQKWEEKAGAKAPDALEVTFRVRRQFAERGSVVRVSSEANTQFKA